MGQIFFFFSCVWFSFKYLPMLDSITIYGLSLLSLMDYFTCTPIDTSFSPRVRVLSEWHVRRFVISGPWDLVNPLFADKLTRCSVGGSRNCIGDGRIITCQSVDGEEAKEMARLWDWSSIQLSMILNNQVFVKLFNKLFIMDKDWMGKSVIGGKT